MIVTITQRPAPYTRYCTAFAAAVTRVGIPVDASLSQEEALAVAMGAFDGADALQYVNHDRADGEGDVGMLDVICSLDQFETNLQHLLGTSPAQVAAKARNVAEAA